MSCGRGEGKDTTMSFYNREIGTLYGVQYIERHIRWLEMQDIRFNLACMNHQRVWGKPTSDLIRLKKPILPERWDGFRNGWSKGYFTVPNFLKKLVELKMMTDSQVDELMKNKPYPDAQLYFDQKRMAVGWNGGWKKTEGIE